jgi:imidazolonepropionase-like amidohydrolase
LVRNGRLPGGAAVDVLVVDGLIVSVGTQLDRKADKVIDAEARFLVPGVIDSHVHLDYLPVGDKLAAEGIAAAVDLAAPFPLRPSPRGLDIVSAGPMLAAPGGYPTRSWGRDGYGFEVDSEESVTLAIDKLHASGASLMKISLGAGPDLSEELLRHAVTYAHGLGMKVAAHVLSDSAAARAANLGADILAHTPVESLQPSTIALWSERAVVSTLVAFGNAPSAAQNLRQLEEAGATILYGTDLGNTRDVGISCSEIKAMQAAGLSDQIVLSAMTRAPADFFGLEKLGSIEVGKSARFLLVDKDPTTEVETLCQVPMVVSDSDS